MESGELFLRILAEHVADWIAQSRGMLRRMTSINYFTKIENLIWLQQREKEIKEQAQVRSSGLEIVG